MARGDRQPSARARRAALAAAMPPHPIWGTAKEFADNYSPATGVSSSEAILRGMRDLFHAHEEAIEDIAQALIEQLFEGNRVIEPLSSFHSRHTPNQDPIPALIWHLLLSYARPDQAKRLRELAASSTPSLDLDDKRAHFENLTPPTALAVVAGVSAMPGGFAETLVSRAAETLDAMHRASLETYLLAHAAGAMTTQDARDHFSRVLVYLAAATSTTEYENIQAAYAHMRLHDPELVSCWLKASVAASEAATQLRSKGAGAVERGMDEVDLARALPHAYLRRPFSIFDPNDFRLEEEERALQLVRTELQPHLFVGAEQGPWWQAHADEHVYSKQPAKTGREALLRALRIAAQPHALLGGAIPLIDPAAEDAGPYHVCVEAEPAAFVELMQDPELAGHRVLKLQIHSAHVTVGLVGDDGQELRINVRLHHPHGAQLPPVREGLTALGIDVETLPADEIREAPLPSGGVELARRGTLRRDVRPPALRSAKKLLLTEPCQHARARWHPARVFSDRGGPQGRTAAGRRMIGWELRCPDCANPRLAFAPPSQTPPAAHRAPRDGEAPEMPNPVWERIRVAALGADHVIPPVTEWNPAAYVDEHDPLVRRESGSAAGKTARARRLRV